MATIKNGANVPLNVGTGTLPNVGGALYGWFQPMTFTLVTKQNVAFQAVETEEEISFRGVIQPLDGRKLQILSEGQQSWVWLMLHSDTSLQLQVDDVVLYLGVRTRVMHVKDYSIYGYMQYNLCQSWEDGP